MFRGSPRRNGAWRRKGVFAVALLVLTAAFAPAAQGSFHLMMVREVHTGGPSGGSYVELQMWTGGQSFVKDHPIVVFGSSGSATHTFELPANVGNGQSQATILVAGPGYAAAFPSGPAPDASDPGLSLPAAGGAVCFTEGDPPDCVAWGNFTGATSLPSPTGSPASPAGVTAGKALHRSIAEPCTATLDPDDDTDDSAADFSEQTPNPRSNSSPIVEKACATAVIDSAPPALTQATGASFTYHSAPAGASFECKLDVAAFADCEADGIEYPGPLGDGKHAFRVRAIDSNGTGTADVHEWTVDTTPPVAEIKSQPKDPSHGGSAAFTYSSNEAGSKFECSLDSGTGDSFGACGLTGKTYTGLANGEYTFKVRATDKAGNEGSSDSFSWTVDNSLADETPPQTTLLSKPPDPSESSAASFTYESNEPGSTFECKLDGGDFAGCAVAGIAYTSLASGPHSFQVRARDASGNVDSTPAGHSWAISVLAATEPPSLAPSVLTPAPAPAPEPPQTFLNAKPGAVTRDRTPTFRFRSSAPGSTFECKLDRGAFRPCSSPFTTKKLKLGAHAVEVRAVAAGSADPSPAKSGFRVAKAKRRKGRR
jgi:large repetitive protein